MTSLAMLPLALAVEALRTALQHVPNLRTTKAVNEAAARLTPNVLVNRLDVAMKTPDLAQLALDREIDHNGAVVTPANHSGVQLDSLPAGNLAGKVKKNPAVLGYFMTPSQPAKRRTAITTFRSGRAT